MPFQQPPLPFAMDAMKPFLSDDQLFYHYDKHHAAYFKNLNALVEGKPEANMPLREVVVEIDRARVQQRGPGMEPQLLLGLHDAQRRRRAAGANWPRRSSAISAASRRSAKPCPRRP